MMTEKFDVIGNVLYRYNSDMEQQESTTFNDSTFETTFMDTQDLLTINVSQPIKRIMKFYNINMGVPESFEELDYNSMTTEQKSVLDDFITENSI
jgi:hypothetical protein